MTNGSVILINNRRFTDDRGWFSETYSDAKMAKVGLGIRFVQDNESWSASAGTVRGIHFQAPPHAQAKLVRCSQGRIMDYAIDLRRASPTYGRHVSAELSAENGRQLLIPVGFGHAFITLTPDTRIAYKVSDIYAPQCEGGVRWDDPDIAIPWPETPSSPTLSTKDSDLPGLKDLISPFAYDGSAMELRSIDL